MRERISIPERATARRSSTQLQRLRSAWLRPAQTINNASVFAPSPQGRELKKLPALCRGAQECATWGSLSGDRASVPPVPWDPRKFLESANSYLTQKVIAQLLSYGRGCLRSPGDLRCPFVHKLPLRFYTVQCTPSAKESESSALQSPGSSLHGSHTRWHRSGKQKRGRSKTGEKPERFALSTLRLWTTSRPGCSVRRVEGLEEREAGRWRALSAVLSSPAEWSPSPSPLEWK